MQIRARQRAELLEEIKRLKQEGRYSDGFELHRRMSAEPQGEVRLVEAQLKRHRELWEALGEQEKQAWDDVASSARAEVAILETQAEGLKPRSGKKRSRSLTKGDRRPSLVAKSLIPGAVWDKKVVRMQTGISNEDVPLQHRCKSVQEQLGKHLAEKVQWQAPKPGASLPTTADVTQLRSFAAGYTPNTSRTIR